MKRVLSLAVVVFVSACHDPTEASRAVVVARFDPSAAPAVVPTPNDLAMDPATGRLSVPVSADASDAERELASYLDTLTGFPPGTDAITDFTARLDPTTVTLAAVRVYDVTADWRGLEASQLLDKPLIYVEDATNTAAPAQLIIRPPVGGWLPGHQYTVALVGGRQGLRGANGEPVVGSVLWQLARSPNPLAVCTDGQYHADGAYPACQATSALFPTTLTEPTAKAADQARQALAVEGLRLRYKSALDHLEAEGVARGDVVLSWAFTVTNQTTARFDPTAGISPTPTDLLADETSGRLMGVASHLPSTASPADVEFAAFLGTLDGYPRDTPGAATFSGALDAKQVTLGTTVRIVDLTADAGVTTAAVTSAGTSSSSPLGALSVTPPVGGWSIGHRYAIALVGGPHGLRDARGEPVIGSSAWALVRNRHALVTCTEVADPACKPTVEGFSSSASTPEERRTEILSAAVQAESTRRRLAPMLDAFEAAGLPREDIALAFSFRVTDQVSLALDPKAACPVGPAPNDLAIDGATGLVNAPLCSGMSDAYKELVTTYLNTLDGYPTGAVAHAPVANGDLDPASITPSTVRVVDVTTAPSAVDATVSYDTTTKSIVVRPAGSGWVKGHRYVVAVVGGASGVKDTAGKQVVAADAFALMRSAASLVTCDDLTSTSCASTLTLASVERSDLLRLESARRQLKPLFDTLAAGTPSLRRSDLVMLWAFRTMSEPELTFDPAAGVIPFPSTFVYDAANQRVALPTAGLTGARRSLVQGLNTLDGFSTTVPIVSERSAARGPIDLGAVDATTLAGHARLLNLSAPTKAVSWAPRVQAATAAAPEQLQFSGTVPLDEATQYGAYVTTDVKNVAGKTLHPSPFFAMVRLTHPLVDGAGTSLLPDLTDAQAQQLEAVRAGHAQLLQGLEAGGVPRQKLALAWAFKTQSTVSALKGLSGLPKTTWASGFGSAPLYMVDASTSVFAQMEAASIPHDHVGKVFIGRMVVPWALSGTTGTLDVSAPVGARVSFFLVTPSSGARPAGFPVVAFQHDLQRQRSDALSIVNALATAGFATFSIDAPWHGDRTTCSGAGAYLSGALGAQVTDDAACADPATQRCDATSGLCVSRTAAMRARCDPATTGGLDPDLFCTAAGQGSCVMTDPNPTAWACQAADLARTNGVPNASGWNAIDLSNPFATRDNQREYVIEMAQVERLLADSSVHTLLIAQGAAGGVDGSSVSFVGQGFGAMLGTLYAASSSLVGPVVLNAPSTDVLDLVNDSPAFATVKQRWLAALHTSGLDPGTAAFDEYLGLVKWAEEAGAPQTAALGVLNVSNAGAGRAVAVQEITHDEVMPSQLADALVSIASSTGSRHVALTLYSGAAPITPYRHGFLLNGVDPITTGSAQADAANFIRGASSY